jgi:hypothetical protein
VKKMKNRCQFITRHGTQCLNKAVSKAIFYPDKNGYGREYVDVCGIHTTAHNIWRESFLKGKKLGRPFASVQIAELHAEVRSLKNQVRFLKNKVRYLKVRLEKKNGGVRIKFTGMKKVSNNNYFAQKGNPKLKRRSIDEL